MTFHMQQPNILLHFLLISVWESLKYIEARYIKCINNTTYCTAVTIGRVNNRPNDYVRHELMKC